MIQYLSSLRSRRVLPRSYSSKEDSERENAREKEEEGEGGVNLGTFAIHPFTQKRIPIYVAEYVISDYGCGVVMGVPSHDTRDSNFAKRHNLEFRNILKEAEGKGEEGESIYELVNSEFLDGMGEKDARESMGKVVKERGVGEVATIYKLRWKFI